MNENESQLHSLAIAHYCVGGVMVLFACVPLFHMFFGLAMIMGWGDVQEALITQNDSLPMPQPFPPQLFGWFFFAMGLVFFLIGQATSIAIVASGRYLKRRKNYTFSFVIACVACMFIPIGTILGVFTIIVLSRESVKGLYSR